MEKEIFSSIFASTLIIQPFPALPNFNMNLAFPDAALY